jgi:hypothetical protein
MYKKYLKTMGLWFAGKRIDQDRASVSAYPRAQSYALNRRAFITRRGSALENQ